VIICVDLCSIFEERLPMEYRQYDDLSVSEIGVGSYGLSGVYGPKDPGAFRQMIRRAHELGVNYFDTAAGYGDAEQLLGAAVAPFRQKVLLATKIAVGSDGAASLAPGAVRRACEQSLARLQTDLIDVYFVHFDDPQTPVAETVAALDELVQEGKIGRYGVSHLPPERIAAYLETGRVFAVMMELSAVARAAAGRLLPLCRQHGAAGIAFSVTGRGLLSGRFQHETNFEPGDIRQMDPLFQRERLESGRRVAAKLAEGGGQLNLTPVQVAIAWVLAQPGITCVLTGPSSVAHLEDNVAASGQIIPPAVLAGVERFFEAEDGWLAEAQRRSVGNILVNPLPTEPQQAFVDLVYVAETAVLLGLVSETAMLPLFHQLIGLRRDLGPGAAPRLATLQQELCELIEV
jgi:aryl-alcohol dehydrogenase-like predicted oxidoreductase